MTKEEKFQYVDELVEKFHTYPNFYIMDAGGLSVADVNDLRRRCFESDVKMEVIKNTLIRKALEKLDDDYSDVYDHLKQQSSVFFVSAENPSVPAKVVNKYRKDTDKKKPHLKVAVIETAVFVGDEQLKTLSDLKSKDELIGEVIGLLQSPAKTVVSALQSGGGKLAGIIKTLSEREEA